MDELIRQRKAQTCFANFCGLVKEYDSERAKECLACELQELCFRTTELRFKVRPHEFYSFPRMPEEVPCPTGYAGSSHIELPEEIDLPHLPGELVGGKIEGIYDKEGNKLPFTHPNQIFPPIIDNYDPGFPKCYGKINEQPEKESLAQCGRCSVKADCLVRAAALFMQEIQGHLKSGEDWKKGKNEEEEENEIEHDAT